MSVIDNAVQSVWEDSDNNISIASTDSRELRELALCGGEAGRKTVPADGRPIGQDVGYSTVTVETTGTDYRQSNGTSIIEKYGCCQVVDCELQRYDGEPYGTLGRERLEEALTHKARPDRHAQYKVGQLPHFGNSGDLFASRVPDILPFYRRIQSTRATTECSAARISYWASP
jgi:hypothetical protein